MFKALSQARQARVFTAGVACMVVMRASWRGGGGRCDISDVIDGDVTGLVTLRLLMTSLAVVPSSLCGHWDSLYLLNMVWRP